MRRPLVAAAAIATLLAVPTVTLAHLDHPVPTITGTAPPLSTEFNSGGTDAEWELLATLPTMNPHSDLDFFTQGGETYMSVGVLGAAVNGGGQSIVRLTKDGKVTPEFVSNHPSASCVSNPVAATGLQHDVEATPKGATILNTDFPGAHRGDAQLLLDASDQAGRCHDQGAGGVQNAPRGGIEIIDVTDIENPKEIGLTSHIGEAHTVNVDPRRPHIAYAVTSDSVSVGADGTRGNETGTGRALDGFEVINLKSCLEAPLGTIPKGSTIEEKRNLCRPEVYRYRYPSVDIALGHTNRGAIYGCHELEVYPNDRLTCGAGAAMIYFDVSKAFDDNGTPKDFTDDKLRGRPLPCNVRDSSTSLAAFKTGAKVTDCVIGRDNVDLGIPGWKTIGSPSLEGVEHLGSAFHMGRESTTGAFQPKQPATEDIDFDHEAELTTSGRYILATDERGGGLAGGAQCSPGTDLKFANGGIHAYRVDRLQMRTPQGETVEERANAAFGAYARDSKGGKAIWRAPVHTEPKGSFCTAHVFQQIPGQNRIFMGWYSQGTQVVDFVENRDGTLDFKQAGYFIPENANQWVSAIFKVEREADGRFTYYGATGDGIVGDAGRNGIDVYKVTLPAPPEPGAGPGVGGGKPGGSAGGSQGSGGKGAPGQCRPTAALSSASARPRGKGVTISFRKSTRAAATVDVFQAAAGRAATRNIRVARRVTRGSSVTWNGRNRSGRTVGNGVYFARVTVGKAVRRITLVRRGGRFRVASDFHKPDTCGLVTTAKLSSPAFGGKRGRALGIAFRLGQAAQVTVTVTRGGKVVKRWRERTYQPKRTVRLKLKARGMRRGEHRVTISAKRAQRQATVQLASRKV